MAMVAGMMLKALLLPLADAAASVTVRTAFVAKLPRVTAVVHVPAVKAPVLAGEGVSGVAPSAAVRAGLPV